MGKTRKLKVNKSEEVRKYMAEHPDAGPKQIAEALKKLKISANYVSTVKNKMKAQPSKGRRGRPPANASADSEVDSLIAAANLIKASGGVDAAKEALRIVSRVVQATST